jgi:hypothetical protein
MNNKEPIEINENAHTKIMKEMSGYLDDCKKKKENCQCTAYLSYNKNETNEFKKWKFMYQCDNQEKTNTIVEKTTLNILNKLPEKKEEIYKVK